MRKKRDYHQIVKHIYHPEITHCLTCKRKLKRCVTISEKTVITLKQVIQVVHCGYRCPESECMGKSLLYRSAEADRLSLSHVSPILDQWAAFFSAMVEDLWMQDNLPVPAWTQDTRFILDRR